MRIKVTQKHICDGEIADPWQCPIALACKEAGLSDPSINSTRLAYKNTEEATVIVPLPKSAKEFISRFDSVLSCVPFEFDIQFEGAAQ